jgi:hypothetical protein
MPLRCACGWATRAPRSSRRRTLQRCSRWGALLAAGCWLLAAGCWLLAAGCWLLAAGCWLLMPGATFTGLWPRVEPTRPPPAPAARRTWFRRASRSSCARQRATAACWACASTAGAGTPWWAAALSYFVLDSGARLWSHLVDCRHTSRCCHCRGCRRRRCCWRCCLLLALLCSCAWAACAAPLPVAAHCPGMPCAWPGRRLRNPSSPP